jgi:hypothetical protein
VTNKSALVDQAEFKIDVENDANYNNGHDNQYQQCSMYCSQPCVLDKISTCDGLRSVQIKLLTCYADQYVVIAIHTQLAVPLTVITRILMQWSSHVATKAHATDYSIASCHVR